MNSAQLFAVQRAAAEQHFPISGTEKPDPRSSREHGVRVCQILFGA
jgi:hypothetical protein